jgi:putative restriction endonuclease
MTRDEILKAFESVRVWQRGGHRAVHKPLLILLALERLARGQCDPVEFAEIEGKMRQLLEEFGPSSAAATPHFPFWHLRTDGLWDLKGSAQILARPPGATPNLGELRAVSGGFPPAIREALQDDPALINEVARRIVDAHFPESIRQDVLEAVGLSLEFQPRGDPEEVARRRDPAFRDKILVAYEYRCCVCGHELRLKQQVIALEAAHIKWFQAGGPDIVQNGLALCSLHHKIFDLGGFTIEPDDYVMVFSQFLVGSSDTQGRLLSYHGAGIVLPQSLTYHPSNEFLEWHAKEVFKSPGRDSR